MPFSTNFRARKGAAPLKLELVEFALVDVVDFRARKGAAPLKQVVMRLKQVVMRLSHPGGVCHTPELSNFRARKGAAPLKQVLVEPLLSVVPDDFRARKGAAPLKPGYGAWTERDRRISALERARPH